MSLPTINELSEIVGKHKKDEAKKALKKREAKILAYKTYISSELRSGKGLPLNVKSPLDVRSPLDSDSDSYNNNDSEKGNLKDYVDEITTWLKEAGYHFNSWYESIDYNHLKKSRHFQIVDPKRPKTWNQDVMRNTDNDY